MKSCLKCEHHYAKYFKSSGDGVVFCEYYKELGELIAFTFDDDEAKKVHKWKIKPPKMCPLRHRKGPKMNTKNLPSLCETDIQNGILSYLSRLHNQGKLWYVRAGSGVIKTEAGNWFKSGTPGCPDILCCVNGRFVGIEVKTAKGKLTDAQVACHAQIEACGGIVFVARSVDDVISIFSDKGII